MSSLDLLDAIERLEMEALRWGFVDGNLTEDEATALAAEILGGGPVGDDAIEDLLDRRLILEVRGVGDEIAYRSRFAETVRLLSRLRQQFDGRAWTTAPRLVSDFRVDYRQRRYPRRDRTASDVLTRIDPAASLQRRAIWSAFTGPTDMDLADFQEAATERLLKARGDAGVIVTAGTGSGKTLAFYLPAMTRVAEAVRPGEFWVKVLAVYPRTELLKDQFSEAFRLLRKADGALAQSRPVSIGAFFASTPRQATMKDVADAKWRKLGDAYVCPWLPCPACGDRLIWRGEDITEKRERLVCASVSCHASIPETQIVLTRNRLMDAAPDVLFTTTEMLNQRLSDLKARRLFGVGRPFQQRPFFALLDEVHTYTGVAGAQAALTLRRWKHALNAPIVYAGLSATLREAPRFFADLVGLPPGAVDEITPGDLVQEGGEYQILLRGDPASQTSLLSTSIQSLMLLARMLDPLEGGRSGGAFGSRLFAFTDNLDVINRLFDSFRDAESLDPFGRPRPGDLPLAALRAPTADFTTRRRRDRDGQVWAAADAIGRGVTAPLVIGRTTSADSGVQADADVIIATAALEVGYNDDRVGAVLQHKAPKDAASFLQRKGRAGRRRGMRPLTVTVLSDYGRDRVAFEAYEHLFDPALPPQRLPVENDYVLRMQATYALFDWIADRSRAPWGWSWDVLSRPSGSKTTPLREAAKTLLLKVVEGHAATLADLGAYLKGALQIDEAALRSLLWSPPRSILLEAAPTLLRRLHRDWAKAHPVPPSLLDIQSDYHPLPDFVARTLFSDLNLPEVIVDIPAATRRDAAKQSNMLIAQALTELAPGRVTRRFATEHGHLHHWSPLDPDLPEQDVPIGQFTGASEEVGLFGPPGASVRVYRPWSIPLHHAPRHVAGPTSNARLNWASEFIPFGEPVAIDLGYRNPWRDQITGVSAYLHRFRSHVAVRRYAPSGEALLRRVGSDRRIRYRFTDDEGNPAAVGFEIDVDALALDLNFGLIETRWRHLPESVLSGCRLAYFRHRLLADDLLPDDIDAFQRDWLQQIVIGAAIARAAATGESLAGAAAALLGGHDAAQHLSRTVDAIFQTPGVADDPASAGDDEAAMATAADGGHASAQAQTLTDVLRRPEVLARLRDLAQEFDAPDPTLFGRWIRDTFVSTMGEALLQACASLAPRHVSTDALVVDVEIGDAARLWVTETTLGGAGVLQAIVDRIVQEPRALSRALEAALAPTDLELAASGLETFVGLLRDDPEVAAATQGLRSETTYAPREAQRRILYSLLDDRGLTVGHALSVSLNARLLTPGARPELDPLLADLLVRWIDLERATGVAISVREISFVFALSEDLRTRVAAATGVAGQLQPADAAQILSNLLWPRTVQISQQALQSYNRFTQRRSTDPRMARALLDRTGQRVPLDQPNWQATAARVLAEDGAVEVSMPIAGADQLRTALVELLITPVDIGYLQFFPKLERTERQGDTLIVTLVIQEQV